MLYHVDTCGCVETRETVEADENGIEVATENDIKEVLKAGYNVVLTANIELTSAIEIEGKEVVINLGGYTITADWVDEDGVVEVLWAKGTGTVVTINGEGSMKSGTGSGTNSVVSSTDGAIVNINGGYYYSASYGAVIFTTRNGAVNIYGGKFEAAEQFESKWYVLDIDERVDPEYFGEINVYGGEFVNYDPVNNTNDSAALANKVADGYHSIKNDNSYVVSKHVYESNVTNPTCEAGGYTTHTCVCGDTYVDSYTDALDHSFTNYVSNEDATCTEDGTKTAKCDRCDVKDTVTDEGSALDHSFTNYASNKDATCTEDGTKTAKCDRCEETKTITDEGSALDHSFTNYVSDENATCTEDGTKTAKCDRCEETKTIADEGSALDHSFTNYVSNEDATCTEDGTKTAKCDRCEETDTVTDEGTKLDHSYGEDWKTDGTNHWHACEKCGAKSDEGEHTYWYGECSVCKKAFPALKDIEFALGEDGSANKENTNALSSSISFEVGGYTLTITSPTKVYDKCTDGQGNSCLKLGSSSAIGGFSFTVPDDVTKVIIYVAKYKDKTSKLTANGKEYTLSGSSSDGIYDEIIVDTTATKTVTISTVSGATRAMINTIVFRVGEECTHSPDAEANCTTPQSCTICGEVLDPAKGHTNAAAVTENEVGATCSAEGSYDLVVKCSVCGDEISRETKIIDKLPHTESDWIVDIQATETTEGSQHKECTVCHEVLNTEVIPTLSHECEYTQKVTAPTCTEKGYTTYTCECGDSYVDNYVDAKGHTEVTDQAVAATCTTTGLTEGKHCSVCNTVTVAQTEVAKSAHTPGAEATCSAPQICTVCKTELNPATGNHNFVSGKCVCGLFEITLTFDANKENRTEFSTTKQVWEQNGITVTNNKGSSTSNVADYSNPVRFYKSSQIIIEYSGITKIVIKCNSNDHVTYCETALKNAGFNVTVNGKDVTVTLSNATDSFEFNATAGQIQIYSIIVYSEKEPPKPCEHTNTTTTTVDATCTEAGSTTVTCDDCDKIVSTEEIAALGHHYENGECTNCHEKEATGDVAATKTTYTFSDYTAGTQYAQGEKHALDNNTTLIINGAHLNTQVRLYAGSNAVIESKGTINKITVKAGYKVGTLTVKVSNDGITWTEVKVINTTTSYTNYDVDLQGTYKYVQLVSAGAQIRVSELTINP